MFKCKIRIFVLALRIHDIKAYGGIVVKLHTFLTLLLDGSLVCGFRGASASYAICAYNVIRRRWVVRFVLRPNYIRRQLFETLKKKQTSVSSIFRFWGKVISYQTKFVLCHQTGQWVLKVPAHIRIFPFFQPSLLTKLSPTSHALCCSEGGLRWCVKKRYDCFCYCLARLSWIRRKYWKKFLRFFFERKTRNI
jgi:hypothetical protein